MQTLEKWRFLLIIHNGEMLRAGRISIISIAILGFAVQIVSSAQSLNDKNFHGSISRSLKAGRGVVLYFYADGISESLENFPAFQKLAEKNPDRIDVYKIDAQSNKRLQDIFGVEYAPTTVAIGPGQGVVRSDEVDLDPKAVGKALTSGGKLKWGDIVGSGIAGGKPTMLFFMTDWCGYCRMLAPQVERFRDDFGDQVNVRFINTEDEENIAEEYLVFGVPVIVIVDSDGLVRDRLHYPSKYEDYIKSFSRAGVKLKKK